jgi:hypothetical protein
LVSIVVLTSVIFCWIWFSFEGGSWIFWTYLLLSTGFFSSLSGAPTGS